MSQTSTATFSRSTVSPVRAFHSWGVTDGLVLTATSGQPGLTMGTGVAVDAAVRLAALAAGCVAVVDPETAPDALTSVVPDNGVLLDTTGVTGGPPRRADLAGGRGRHLPRGQRSGPAARTMATVGPGGEPGRRRQPGRAREGHAGRGRHGHRVTAGLRRLPGARIGSIGLSVPDAPADGPGALTVSQSPVAELVGDAGGNLTLSLLSGAEPRPVLRIEQATFPTGLVTTAGLDVGGVGAGRDLGRATSASKDAARG